MYRSLFTLIGALFLWSLSGFRGKLDDFVGPVGNYPVAFVGMVIFLALFLALVFIVQAAV